MGKPEHPVTRRRFIAALTLAAGGTAVAPLAVGHVEAASSPPAKEPDHQWAFVVDLRRCDGCEHCTKACQAEHYLAKDQKWINVYKLQDANGQNYFMPRLCMHCENAPCEKVCPVGATFKNPEGVVLVDQNICIGCRTCMAACPYEARYFNWNQPPAAPAGLSQKTMPEYPVPGKKGTVGKCILCVHLTEMGKLPACVEGCPMQALYVGDMKTDVATNGVETVKLSTFLRANDATRFREDLGTRPRLYYITGHGQNITF